MRLEATVFLLLFIALVYAQNENITSRTTDGLLETEKPLKLDKEGPSKNGTEIIAATKENLNQENRMTTPNATDPLTSSKGTRDLDKGGKFLEKDEEFTLSKKKSISKGGKKHKSKSDRYDHDEEYDHDEYDDDDDEYEHSEHRSKSRGKHKHHGKSHHSGGHHPKRGKKKHGHYYDDSEEHYDHDDHYEGRSHHHKMRPYGHYGEHKRGCKYASLYNAHKVDYDRKLEQMLKTLERMEPHKKYGCSCESKEASHGKSEHHSKDAYEEKMKSMLSSLEKLVNKQYESGKKEGYVDYASHKDENKVYYPAEPMMSKTGSSYQQYARSAVDKQSTSSERVKRNSAFMHLLPLYLFPSTRVCRVSPEDCGLERIIESLGKTMYRPWSSVVSNGRKECAATIINEYYALTSASCLKQIECKKYANTALLAGKIGSTYRNKYIVENCIIHEKYSELTEIGQEHDIGLVKIAKALPLKTYSDLSAVCLSNTLHEGYGDSLLTELGHSHMNGIEVKVEKGAHCDQKQMGKDCMEVKSREKKDFAPGSSLTKIMQIPGKIPRTFLVGVVSGRAKEYLEHKTQTIIPVSEHINWIQLNAAVCS